MTNDFQQLMNHAAQMTRSGDLQAATAAIQAALGRGQLPDFAASPGGSADVSEVIDVEARQLPDAAPSLAQAGAAAEAATPPPTAVASTTARFIDGSFALGGMKRDYKLFIPAGAGAGPMPLVVMLHGCTQTPDDFAAGTAMNVAAQAQGFYVLYPAQSKQANPQRCWNWFKHTHQQRGRGEPALLAGMTRHVMSLHPVDPDRVYVAGLSAGGAMAAILADTYADLYAAAGVHSGLAAGAASDLPSALAAMKGDAKRRPAGSGRAPMIVFHGDADGTVHHSNGEQVIAANSDAAIAPEVSQQEAPGKRRSTRRVHRDAAGTVRAEHWVVHGAPHAWSGGSVRGSYTDTRGPDASTEMLRFFLEHPRRASR